MSENNNEKIKVLLFRPGEYARTVEIDDTLEGMQEAVGGWIEEYMPFEDDVAIVCNEEGKLQGLEFNRAIFNDEGQLLDVIAGDFFIAYAPPESEKYLSITPELEKKYKEKYGKPERIFFNGHDFESIKYDPDKNERSKDFERLLTGNFCPPILASKAGALPNECFGDNRKGKPLPPQT